MAIHDDMHDLIDDETLEPDGSHIKPFRDVVDEGVEMALQVTPRYKAKLRSQLQRAIDFLDGKSDPATFDPETLGEIVEYMFASVAMYDREAYPTLIENVLIGLEQLVGLEMIE